MNTLKVFPPQSKTDITVVTVTKDRTEEDEKKFIRSVAEAIFRGQQHVSSFEGAGLQFMVFEGLSPEQGEIICQTAPKFPKSYGGKRGIQRAKPRTGIQINLGHTFRATPKRCGVQIPPKTQPR